MRFAVVVVALLAACSSNSGSEKRKPSGTPTDPVEECERAGDVCRLDDARLGVCVASTKPTSRCAGDTCYECMSQH